MSALKMGLCECTIYQNKTEQRNKEKKKKTTKQNGILINCRGYFSAQPSGRGVIHVNALVNV